MKIGVMDIGTRATRLLLGDTDSLHENGFQFTDYHNDGTLTEAGRGIVPVDDGEFEMRIERLESTVRFMQRLVDKCDRYGVEQENRIAVGTEVFRRVRNWESVIDVIEHTTGVRIQVLDPFEEAETTFWACTQSCLQYITPEQPYMVIEQGGGSTQVTIAQVDEDGAPTKHAQISIPELGTVLLRERFLEHSAVGPGGGARYVRTVRDEIEGLAREKIDLAVEEHLSPSASARPKRAFALGSVITNFHRGSNRQVHCKPVRRDELTNDPVSMRLLDAYSRYTVKALLTDAENGQIPEDRKEIERKLERLYGAPCYAALLDAFDLGSLRICGTGLRYGVLFRKAYKQWRNIRLFQG